MTGPHVLPTATFRSVSSVGAETFLSLPTLILDGSLQSYSGYAMVVGQYAPLMSLDELLRPGVPLRRDAHENPSAAIRNWAVGIKLPYHPL